MERDRGGGGRGGLVAGWGEWGEIVVVGSWKRGGGMREYG